MTSNIERRQPSIKLITEIDSCLSSIDTLKGRIHKTLALGTAEGFTELEMGDIIRQRADRMGLPSSTVRYYLPAAAKHQEKARAQVKQLAPDSISKVIRVEAQPSATNTNEEFALNLGANAGEKVPEESSISISKQPSYEELKAAAEAELELPNPDSSLLIPVDEDYKIELLDQYDKPYLMKVVKYLHEQVTSSGNESTEQEENTQLKLQVEQLTEQVKELSKQAEIGKTIRRDQQDEILRLKVQLRRAGIEPAKIGAEAAAA